MNKQRVREWQADFDRHHHLEIVERQQMTFADRLEALTKILQFARQMQMRPRHDDSESVFRRWQQIRERYARPD